MFCVHLRNCIAMNVSHNQVLCLSVMDICTCVLLFMDFCYVRTVACVTQEYNVLQRKSSSISI